MVQLHNLHKENAKLIKLIHNPAELQLVVLALDVSSVVRQGIEWLIARRVAGMVRVYLLRVNNVLMII